MTDREHSGGREKRKLAAILAADVAGYSRLMGPTEAGTLARLKVHRKERFEPSFGSGIAGDW
jgi:adenylate cyclase